ncbi:hypothetical protein CAEBREN_06401 [Caenorhabditis brenneri]|uniref:Uncharacterized protein n=1 Tax=Caenorhabditis brenneri TaxID=135651 RepID=G0N881_CAEBE|nr:hypothetical protein CAEBREN_06401 [Caenorhabditis brenneri]
MPDSQIRIFPKYEYTVTCEEQDSQKISVVRHYGAILVDGVLTKLYSNLSYAPIPTGDYFLIDQHQIEKWRENETKHESDVISFETFSDLYMETFYIRLLPLGGPGEQKILADEVLRLIPAVLKKQGKDVDQALLVKYRETWSAPDNFYRTISLDELNDVLDDFQIDKTKITAVPDIALIISQDEMLKKCTRPVQTYDIQGNEIISAAPEPESTVDMIPKGFRLLYLPFLCLLEIRDMMDLFERVTCLAVSERLLFMAKRKGGFEAPKITLDLYETMKITANEMMITIEYDKETPYLTVEFDNDYSDAVPIDNTGDVQLWIESFLRVVQASEVEINIFENTSVRYFQILMMILKGRRITKSTRRTRRPLTELEHRLQLYIIMKLE